LAPKASKTAPGSQHQKKGTFHQNNRICRRNVGKNRAKFLNRPLFFCGPVPKKAHRAHHDVGHGH
jgi:hypothetical protein